MSSTVELEVFGRETKTRGDVRRVRRGQQIPAVVYGDGRDPIPVSLNEHEFTVAMQDEAFGTKIIDLKLDKLVQQVILRDVQRNPVNDSILHVDFMRINEDRQIQVSVPIHFLNEEECVGVRTSGGVISHNLIDVEIECLPKDIPEFIEVDIAELDLGQSIHLSDLSVPEDVSIVALQQAEHSHDIQVVAIHARRAEIEETEVDEDEFGEIEEAASAIEESDTEKASEEE